MRATRKRIPSSNHWDGNTVIEIYPHTFNEAPSEEGWYRGQGNLRGIIEKLDFIKYMGYDAIWITPFYPSPMRDGGYDISDHTQVDARLGSLEDFKELVKIYHEHGIKIMIDLVPNHTSDQHEWFKESRKSRDNPKSDWYIWRDALPSNDPSAPPQPPNNWSSVFSFPNLRARQRGELIVPEGENTPPVSAWQWDEIRQQFYLRDFDESQPNLNWNNPDVVEAIQGIESLWLDRGADGVRVDVGNHTGKDLEKLRNEEPNPNYQEGIDNPHDQHLFNYSLNYMPALKPNLKALTDVIRRYPKDQYIMILECWMTREELREIDTIAPEIASAFNFTRLKAPWNARVHQRLLDEQHATLPDKSIPNQVIMNHDVEGPAKKFGPATARSMAVMNHSLPGLIFSFQKELGGFIDADVPASRKRDDELGERDGVRTPMRWDGSKNAGFSKADEKDLWLPVDPEYKEDNLEIQAQNPNSSLSLYRDLIHLRTKHRVLKKGIYAPLKATHEDVVAFGRHDKDDRAITLVNFSDRPITTQLLKAQHFIGPVVISSITSSPDQIIDTDRPIVLQPNEAIIALKIT